jgi:hypothetical protein
MVVNELFNSVTPSSVQHNSGSSLKYLTTTINTALGQNPDLTFPNKKNVVIPEIIDSEKNLLKKTITS